ncbi:MAG: HD domain-containing protein [Eubacterium sp.]|nr:HD domain-containing protein [Eubacterium sp.]MDE6863564.1 HD domain-containing protein [Eubacterium sp.]
MASFALIKELSEKKDKNGNGFLDLIIIGSDKKEYPAKIWRFDNNGQFEANDVIEIDYTVDNYKGKTQLNITTIKKAPDEMISSFVPSSEYDGKAVFSMLLAKVNNFADEVLKSIVSKILLDNREALEVYPAAYRLHHAIVGGLMLHTASIVEMAEKTCTVYPNINRELLLSGAILHDVAKTFEMNTAKSGLCSGYTIGGELIGHLVKGAMYIEDTAKELGIEDEKVTLLEHMVLSHHGVPEYGSPVRPMFLEAEILSTLDSLDATIFEINNATNKINTGSFTERQWALDNRKLFNHGLSSTEHKVNLGE